MKNLILTSARAKVVPSIFFRQISDISKTPNSPCFWLRAETLLNERRTILTPQSAEYLIREGAEVVVEECKQRIFPTLDYAQVGCEIKPAGSWQNQAPITAYILGLKQLLDANIGDENYPLKNYHSHFAHAYKGQKDAPKILDRFDVGNGVNLDLEYLVDAEGKRIAAFGFYAGYATAALAINVWCQKQLGNKPPFKIPHYYENKTDLLEELKSLLKQVRKKPDVLVIGKNGRSGKGATELLKNLEIETTCWGRQETVDRSADGIPAIADHQIFLNCVFTDKVQNPFVTDKILHQPNAKLSVIGDITCDFGSKNMIQISGYEDETSLSQPTFSYKNNLDLDIVAITNTPNLLPKEASEDFSKSLVKYLAILPPNPTDIPRAFNESAPIAVWGRALNKFIEVSESTKLKKSDAENAVAPSSEIRAKELDQLLESKIEKFDQLAEHKKTPGSRYSLR